jgi:hypothetical protein
MLPPITAAHGIEVYAVCARRPIKSTKEREKPRQLAQKEFEIVAKRYLRDLRRWPSSFDSAVMTACRDDHPPGPGIGAGCGDDGRSGGDRPDIALSWLERAPGLAASCLRRSAGPASPSARRRAAGAVSRKTAAISVRRR